MVRWVKILLRGTTSRVRINGFFSPSFAVSNALAQGASVSCQEWAIVLQPLVSYLESLRAQGCISTIILPSGGPAPASLQFADDTKNPQVAPDTDGPVTQAAFGLYGSASGVGQSILKCRLVALPALPAPPSLDPALTPMHAATNYRLVPDDEPARLLGAPFSTDYEACCVEAYRQAPGKI
jgi:hypothetical protein